MLFQFLTFIQLLYLKNVEWEWQFPGNVPSFAAKTLCELRQVLHLKRYYFHISNITIFTDYSVWEFSSCLYSFLVSNEKWGTKKPDISNPSKRNYLWHEKNYQKYILFSTFTQVLFWVDTVALHLFYCCAF